MRKLLAAMFAVLFVAGVVGAAEACPYKGKDADQAQDSTS